MNTRRYSRLKARDGDGLQVVNAGYSRSPLDHQIVAFDEQDVQLQPDVVLLHFFVNDLEDLLQREQALNVYAPVAEEHLERLVAKVERTCGRSRILVIPDWYQVTTPRWNPLPQRMMVRLVGDHDTPVVDALETFRKLETPAATLYLDPDTDGHLNPRGDAVVAEMLFDELGGRLASRQP